VPDDKYWDADKNEVKGAEFATDIKAMVERDAAAEVRKGSLPKTADEYKAELPADFKAPAGVEFKIDPADPLIATARAQAHAMGATQEDFSKMLGIYAAAKVGEQARVDAARAAEITKLGPTASARVDAVTRWMTSIDSTADKGDAAALAGMMVTARHVEAFERLITRITSQGAAGFSQQHRVSPDASKIPNYAGMSFEQRRAAQDAQRAQRA
jgi:hypothetical protein